MKSDVIQCALMALCLALAGCSETAPQAPTPANTATVFSLVEHQHGRVMGKATITSDAALFNDLAAYFQSPDIAKGNPTIISFVPAILIETDTVQINLMETQVVVSTRNSIDEAWRPAVRAKTSRDSKIEDKLRALLQTTAERNLNVSLPSDTTIRP